MRQGRFDRVVRPEQIDIDDRLEGILRQAGHGRQEISSSTTDDEIDPTESIDHLLDGGSQVGGFTDVTGSGETGARVGRGEFVGRRGDAGGAKRVTGQTGRKGETEVIEGKVSEKGTVQKAMLSLHDVKSEPACASLLPIRLCDRHERAGYSLFFDARTCQASFFVFSLPNQNLSTFGVNTAWLCPLQKLTSREDLYQTPAADRPVHSSEANT